jgi:hypothetical protein
VQGLITARPTIRRIALWEKGVFKARFKYVLQGASHTQQIFTTFSILTEKPPETGNKISFMRIKTSQVDSYTYTRPIY